MSPILLEMIVASAVARAPRLLADSLVRSQTISLQPRPKVWRARVLEIHTHPHIWCADRRRLLGCRWGQVLCLQDWVPESVSRVSEPALLAVVKKISMSTFSCLMTSEAPRYKVPPSSPARVSVFTFLLSCVGGSQKFSTSILIRWASVGVSMVVLPPRRSWPL